MFLLSPRRNVRYCAQKRSALSAAADWAATSSSSLGASASVPSAVWTATTLKKPQQVIDAVNVPVIASGGAGSAGDFVTLFKEIPEMDAGLAARRI